VAAVAALALASWSFSEVWTDSESLWRWAVDLDPTCSVCHGKLGESVLTGPDGITHVAEAEGLFRRAIALRPDLPDAYYNLGTVLVLQGRYREAEAPLREYMTRVPAAASGPERLGLVYLLEGRHAEAVPLLREALARKTDSTSLRGYLTQALEGASRQLRAEGRLEESDRLVAEARALGTPAASLQAWPAAIGPSSLGGPPRP
jgi:tetratricopeptide (TPR) repeat protein